MIIGRLNHQITLQKMKTQRDPSSNEPVQIVASESKVWANFQGLRATDDAVASLDIQKGYGVFRIRYFEDIWANTWRIKDWKNRLWDIRGEPVEVGVREGLDLFAELEQHQ